MSKIINPVNTEAMPGKHELERLFSIPIPDAPAYTDEDGDLTLDMRQKSGEANTGSNQGSSQLPITQAENPRSRESNRLPNNSPRPKDDPAFDFLVEPESDEQEGLFPSGEVSLIAGPSGAGKSSFMVQFMLSLRHGELFLGRKTRPKPYVLFLADRSENSLKRTARRMHIDVNDLNAYREPDEVAEAPKHLATVIKGILKMERYKDTKVFFIEGLDMLVPEGKTSDLTSVSKFVDKLQRLALEKGLTIIGTVGSPKMKANDRYQSPRDCIFGSVGWGRKVETIIYIEQKNVDDPDSLRRLWILSRNGKEERKLFRWENGHLVETQDPTLVSTDQRVMEWMQKQVKPGEEFQLKQVTTALGCPDSTVQSALDKLVKEGRIQKPRHGRYLRPDAEAPPAQQPRGGI